MGVFPRDLDDDRREALSFEGEGILVEDVVDGSPAKKAGIKPGDIITGIDDDEVEDEANFRSIIRSHEPGDEVTVHIVRDGKKQDISFKLGKRNASSVHLKIPTMTWIHNADDEPGFLGVESLTLDDQLAEYFEVKEGALIQKVVKDSPAEKAGIKAGDVIVKLGSDDVRGTEGLRSAIRRHEPGDSVKVKLMRKGKEMTLDAVLSEAPSVSRIGGEGRKIIVRGDNEVSIDLDELREQIDESLKDMDIHIRDGGDELRKEVERLKQEVKELREQMKERQKEKKEEPK